MGADKRVAIRLVCHVARVSSIATCSFLPPPQGAHRIRALQVLMGAVGESNPFLLAAAEQAAILVHEYALPHTCANRTLLTGYATFLGRVDRTHPGLNKPLEYSMITAPTRGYDGRVRPSTHA